MKYYIAIYLGCNFAEQGSIVECRKSMYDDYMYYINTGKKCAFVHRYLLHIIGEL